ncbi:ParB/RepB/Spo0J family partition protein [Rhodococcus sp. NPDC019627]|uniref:ParB/RepB/Spo0J family partition protein n=1 Tax=unclassified Rhodococcus (in: high G+C Gram-positive bacteria) TaxID=192944 RepID=UPI0033C8F239
MTANTTDTATTAHAELVYLNPVEAEIEPNTRDSVDPVKLAELTESIREHGVLQAIKAVRYADGTIRVRDGQCRTLAARDAGLTRLPALVTPDTATSDTERGIERITQQIVANDHRNDLTAGQRAAGVAQMLDLGASVTKVSKAIQLPREQVKALAAVGASVTVRERLDQGQLTLERAQVIADFDIAGDDDAVAELLSPQCWNFRATAERLRRDRAERAARADAAAPYAERGYVILTEEPSIVEHITLDDLRTTTGEPVTAEHTTTTPALWGVWVDLDEAYFDRETGEEVDGESVDWSTEDDDEAQPEDGFRHANTVETRPVWVPEYVFLDPATLEGSGFELTETSAALHTTQVDGTHAATDAPDPQTQAIEAARRDREQQEAQKHERRRVRELNKAAEAATTVRRDFLRTTLLARKTPPKNAAAWVTATLATDPQLLGEYHAGDHLGELLGLTGFTPGKNIAELADKSSEARAHVLTLALVVAAMEGRMVKDGWRHRPRGAATYLDMLAANGHELTDVEKAIAGQLDPTAIDID